MRIMFVNALYLPDKAGGAENTINSIASGLASRGHQVSACVLHDKKAHQVDEVNGVRVHRLPLSNIYWPFGKEEKSGLQKLLWHGLDVFNVSMAAKLAHVVKEERPDLISFHNLQGWSAASWLKAHNLGVPCIQVLHDYYHLCPKVTMYKDRQNCNKQCSSCEIFRLPHRKLSNNLSAVVGISQFALNAHTERGLFGDVKIKHVINNARRLPDPPIREQSDRAFTIGFIGSLTPVKGIEELIDAYKTVYDKVEKPIRLKIAGRGKQDYQSELEARCQNYPVEFVGQVEPASFYPTTDIVVIPSMWNEPLGGVVIESLHYGVPTLAAARGGITDIIKNGVNGLLFDPDQPKELESALERVLTDADLRNSITKHAAQSIEHFLDLGRMVDEYESLMRRVSGND